MEYNDPKLTGQQVVLYHSLTFAMPFWGYCKMTVFKGGLIVEECVHFMDIYLVKSCLRGTV